MLTISYIVVHLINSLLDIDVLVFCCFIPPYLDLFTYWVFLSLFYYFYSLCFILFAISSIIFSVVSICVVINRFQFFLFMFFCCLVVVFVCLLFFLTQFLLCFIRMFVNMVNVYCVVRAQYTMTGKYTSQAEKLNVGLSVIDHLVQLC
jgi:hypothetical protein